MIELAVTCCLALAAIQEKPHEVVIARAGNEEITEAHLRLVGMLSGHKQMSPELRSEVTKRLVETRFATRYLKREGFKVSSAQLRLNASEMRAKLKVKGVDLRAKMKELKLTDRDLRRELEARKLWNQYKQKRITSEVIRARFKDRSEQYDGTRVRASQIFLKAKDDAEWKKVEATLKQLRSEIAAGNVKFADAAKEHSQSPSSKQGGDVGWFPYSGLMPADFSKRAFALKKGEMTQPFRSRYGAHLVLATDREQGRLFLEDARPVIYRELEREEWERIVQAEKSRKDDADGGRN